MKKRRESAILAWILVFSMVLSMFTSAIPSMAAEMSVSTENNFDAMSMEQIMAQDKSITWVFAGDSITHNAGWSGGMNSYSEWFEQYLYDIGRGDDAVLLSAWGGANTYDFQYYENTPSGYGPKVDAGKGLENMITKYNPDVVFLKLGMNERYKTTENIIKTYNQILDGVYAEGLKNGKIPKIILLSSTPLSDETFYDDQFHTEARAREIRGSVKRSRDEIEKIANERGLTFVDLRTAFIEESLRLGEDYSRTFYSDSSDGTIHPNAAGQYYIFKTLSREIGIYDENMPIYQLKYDDILSQAMYVDGTLISDYSGAYGSTTDWSTLITENYVWAVAGAVQMSGYEGAVPHRSMFRFIDNAMRYDEHRDIRLFNLASPAYENGVNDLLANYEKTMVGRAYDVFLLLPEIPEVYESGYVHSTDLVVDYKENVLELLSKNEGKKLILWTPLASSDVTINTYISEYAEVIREIATENSDIFFFDANQFMNDKMTENPSLKTNWFEEGAYVSPLCADDVVFAFYKQMGLSGTGMNALKNRNLRYTSDTQVFKGNYVRDYIKADTTVTGTTVTVDVSAIKAAYPELELALMVMPEKATGNYHENIRLLSDVASVTESENVYSFEAPCADLNLAIYGTSQNDELIYRFKDISLSIETTATIPEKTNETPDGVYLDSLKIMSAPDFEFDSNTKEYTVDLYQYQTYATVRATAQAGLTITVNGKVVASNALSTPIKVENGSRITVDVTDGTTTETYTLVCSKPEQPDIIITEVMQDGYASYTVANSNDNYELVEIYNASGRDLNLLDYSLGFKKDYTYNNVTESNSAEYPYYFTGNDQAFGGDASYTGIKPITKYSVYWEDKVNEEPEEVIFKADSTMVIWIRSMPQSTEEKRAAHAATLTYETLRTALEEQKGTHTLTVDVDGVETAVVPQESQLVVAEVTVNVKSAVLTNRAKKTAEVADTTQNYVMDNFTGIYNASTATRGWLFILEDSAEFARNGAITEAGNDIITAAKFSRVGKEVDDTVVGTDKLSSVFSYNYDRGMSVVRNENVVNVATIGQGNTSDVMGYSNLTSFGAIEYWQKPLDFGDEVAPVIVDNTNVESDNIAISLKVSDDQDIRYVELFVRKAGDTEFIKISKDYVLETGVKNAGLTADVKSVDFSYVATGIGETAEYYVKAYDGNENVTTLGSEENPIVASTLKIVKPYSAEDAKAHIGKQNNVPVCETEGYAFAGWYLDEACVGTPIAKASEAEETVYALFVSKKVLTAKAQLSVEVLTDDTDKDMADIRFVSTIDSLQYKKVGFKFVINEQTINKRTNSVYKRLYAMNKDGKTEELLPEMISSVSNYFFAVTVKNIPSSAWDTSITVTPYWVTADGVTVEGETTVKTVNQGRNDSAARIEGMYYDTLAEAVVNASDGDEVEVLRDTSVDTTMTIDKNITITNAVGSTVAITRDANLQEAMLTVTNKGNLTITGTGEHTITLDGDKENVAATESMIVNAGTFTLGEGTSLINGGNEELKFAGGLTNTGKAIIEGEISGHTAQYGGAVYNYSKGTVTFNGGVLQNNTATVRGGVVYGTGTSKTVVTAGEFKENTATGTLGGGAISIAGNALLNVSGGHFHDNAATATATTAYGGGAIESNGEVVISGGLFESNTALNGGAIYMDVSGKLSISGGEFYSNQTINQTDAAGGVIYIKGNTLAITGGTFGAEDKGNVSYQRGGAIYVADRTAVPTEANISIQNATFSHNVAMNGTKASGGMMYVGKNSVVDIEDCIVEYNKTVDSNTSTKGIYYLGGAMYINAASVNVANTSFNYNEAGNGGVFYATDSASNLVVSNSNFSNNIATAVTSSATDVDGLGGVIYINEATVEIKNNSTFTANTAFRGGAIGLGNNGVLTLSDCKFVTNTATGNFGRDIIYNSGSLTLSGKIENAQIDKRANEIIVKGELDSTSKIEIMQISGNSGIVQVRFDSAKATEVGAQCISYYKYYSTVNSGKTLQFDTENCYAIMK